MVPREPPLVTSSAASGQIPSTELHPDLLSTPSEAGLRIRVSELHKMLSLATQAFPKVYVVEASGIGKGVPWLGDFGKHCVVEVTPTLDPS